MIKGIFLFLITAAIGSGTAYLAGVRFHSEALQDYAPQSKMDEPRLHKLILKNGEELTGEIVKEDDRSVSLQFEGGSIDFSRAEIAGIIKPEDLSEEDRALVEELQFTRSKSSLITYEEEKNWFLQIGKGGIEINPVADIENKVGLYHQTRDTINSIQAVQTSKSVYHTAKKAAQK